MSLKDKLFDNGIDGDSETKRKMIEKLFVTRLKALLLERVIDIIKEVL